MRALTAALAVLAGVVALALGLVLALLAAGAGATALIAGRAEARFPPAGRFVAVQGGRLAVLEAEPEGAARGAIVLLHGASSNAADPMAALGPALAARGFRVLAFDRPGYGWSDRLGGPEAADPAFQAARIAEGLAAMGVGPAIVLGHSWSGALALRLALDHPERVSGLVLAAPVALPFPARRLPWWVRLALDPTITRILAYTLAVPAGRYWFEDAARAAFAPQPLPADFERESRARLILRPGPARANIADLAGLPAALAVQAPRYGSITCPTTIVAGDADPVVAVHAQAVPLREAIPGARLVRLPGVGHMLHYVATQAVVEAVAALPVR